MSTYGKSIDFLFNQMRNGSEGSLAAGEVYFYSAGTTVPKAVWLDRDKTLPTVGGVYSYTLTADGTAELFGDGIYYIVVKDSNGVTIYDYDNVSIFPSPAENSSSGSLSLIDASGGATSTTLGATPITIIKTDSTANVVNIYPPVGTVLASGVPYHSLTVQNESVSFTLSGAVYYEV